VCVGHPRQCSEALSTLYSSCSLTQALGPGDTHMSSVVSPGEDKPGKEVYMQGLEWAGPLPSKFL